ncbi:FAS1 domain-containing protein [Chaetomium sp. MPI-CAGE-AT-0009]|nr:FAS1 domain-containing protein [Chaetomium sp. MPI-CAGE-AT-0009]
MLGQHLLGFVTFFGVLAGGQSLVTVLEGNGFTEYAALIRGDPSFEAASDLVIYAPTNAALMANNDTVTRRATEEDLAKTRARFAAVNLSAPRPREPPTRRPPVGNITRLVRHRNELLPPGFAFVTLLDDPEYVNLGPGVNQSIVEKRDVSSEFPVVCSGLGETIMVTGHDIPFDKGVIRPTNGLPTLPQNVSATLPFLGVHSFLDALNQTGLLAELDARTGPITILAPDDNAFKNRAFTRDQLTTIVRQHVLLDYSAYTPLLRDGQAFPTLGGREVIVSVDAKGAVSLGGARILTGDAILVNGAVHTIDKILDPSASPPGLVTGAANNVMAQSWKALVASAVGIMMTARYLI